MHPQAARSPLAEAPPRKSISLRRDQRQSRVLTVCVALALLLAVTHALGTAAHIPIFPLLFSTAFALIAWRLRAATPSAAALGGLLCLLLSVPPLPANRVIRLALVLALITLFLLTFAATRFRRSAKEGSGLAEKRTGRRASQILANLGIAGLCAAVGFIPGALAALAEATADTVSSEVGQALRGPTWLLTTLRPVPPGTDGGISLPGSAPGILASALVVLAGAAALPSHLAALLVFLSAVAGLVFDSLLGATLERRGLLGNDLVNFSSTAFAALVLWLLRRAFGWV